jgi:glycerol-3-phosphate O-acyltransferase 3/4
MKKTKEPTALIAVVFLFFPAPPLLLSAVFTLPLILNIFYRADTLDLSGTLNDAAAALVDDSFLRCFKSSADDPWNWNFYLFPLWCCGVFIRNFILFPLRVITLLTGFLLFFIGFSIAGIFLSGTRRKHTERALVRFLARAFTVSWTGVVRYHGPRPVPTPGRVWVANHTSMIDYAVLCAFTPFAAIMQLHPGWVGMMQKRYLSALGCLWFNRTQSKDRALVQQRMRDHVWATDATPLLIFPEGTCVNNEYCVMFKRGAFDLGATVCPIAIKYNKIFVDAFWNSKRQSFTQHLFKIMRSWALVADVWFLEPQTRREDESSTEFAERVQKMIADRARLKIAPWDGYLKYYNLGEKHPDLVERQRKLYGERLKAWL